jgi:NarL family two-component system sensor histidine kinase LiaS
MAHQVQTLLEERQQLVLLAERQRVARDLHDAVKQQTFALTLLIGAGKKYLGRDPAQAHRYLTEAEELADQTRQELTTIIRELRPLALAEKGLATVLRQYLSQWSRRTGITASVSVKDISSLPPEQGEQLFRVTQEALTNVARHSQADRVSVRLWRETEQVCLSVGDNGQGFEVMKAAGKGLGLATMRERIESSQGTMRISSTNEGTLVEVHMPSTGEDHPVGSNSNKEMINE